MTHIKRLDDIRAFLLAGKANFTLKSLTSGKHYTYKVVRGRRGSDMEHAYFVRVLTNPPDGYAYVGMLMHNANGTLIRPTKASTYKQDSPCVVAINYLLKLIDTNVWNPNLEFHHTGICARCGRKLTDPESIERGFGPECIKHIGGY